MVRKDLDTAVERMRAHAWKVAFGSGVLLAITITSLVVRATDRRRPARR